LVGASPPSIPRRNLPAGVARPEFAGRIVADEQVPNSVSGRRRDHRERIAAASRHHRHMVPAIFDDGGSFSQIEIAVRPKRIREGKLRIEQRYIPI
jgi:hypothetical protein